MKFWKRFLVEVMEMACEKVDRLPNWTYPFVGTWLGCPAGLARWSAELDERWGTGVWQEPPVWQPSNALAWNHPEPVVMPSQPQTWTTTGGVTWTPAP